MHCPFAHQAVRGRKENPARSGRLVQKANQALRDRRVLLVPQDLLAHRVLRARKVLLATPRTLFELYVSTARPQRAEGSATRTRFL